MRPADVIDSLKDDQVDDPRLRQYVAIKACQRVYASAVIEDAVAANTFVHNCDAGKLPLMGQSIRQEVRPVCVIALLGSSSVRDRIAERHEGASLSGCKYLKVCEEVPRVRFGRDRHFHLSGEIADRGDVGLVLAPEMQSRCRRHLGNEQANSNLRQGSHIEGYRVAQH